MLLRSIEALHQHPLITDITVVLAAEDRQFVPSVGALADEIQTVIGGDSRAQSVLNGLNALAEKYSHNDWVVVHDAARPCLSQAGLDRLFETGLNIDDGAILAMPVADTLKRCGSQNEIVGTVDRQQIWAAQTPQLFRLGVLKTALESAMKQGLAITDEASAIELAGGRPKLVEGAAGNIKITWPGDLQIAESILKSEKKGQSR